MEFPVFDNVERDEDGNIKVGQIVEADEKMYLVLDTSEMRHPDGYVAFEYSPDLASLWERLPMRILLERFGSQISEEASIAIRAEAFGVPPELCLEHSIYQNLNQLALHTASTFEMISRLPQEVLERLKKMVGGLSEEFPDVQDVPYIADQLTFQLEDILGWNETVRNISRLAEQLAEIAQERDPIDTSDAVSNFMAEVLRKVNNRPV